MRAITQAIVVHAWRTELLPACLMGVCVTAILSVARLYPIGKTLLLVHLPHGGPGSALQAAAASGAQFVSRPNAEYAVLFGDADRVRRAAGLAIDWKGAEPCSPRQ